MCVSVTVSLAQAARCRATAACRYATGTAKKTPECGTTSFLATRKVVRRGSRIFLAKDQREKEANGNRVTGRWYALDTLQKASRDSAHTEKLCKVFFNEALTTTARKLGGRY